MCLELKGKPKVLKASKNIKVYKAFDRVTPGGFAVTPYQRARYRRGVVKRVKKFTSEIYHHQWTDTALSYIYAVDAGIHSCKSQRLAAVHGSVIVECVIPRGTLYMVGKYNGVVSLALKPVKAVDGPKASVQRFNARRV